ncbi:lipoprotein [Candidatus Soleaferrea massiliensis]|uniref:LptM family lipoprotein n=1 Tax=Candidatus Soleaferrea massiliensis TaxID=1470354 RepID=UPI00058D000C|nr:acid shock protein [Candidatus Soleaferrea massiliensis]
MKKILAVIVAAMMAVSLSACAAKQNLDDAGASAESQTSSAAPGGDSGEGTSEEPSKPAELTYDTPFAFDGFEITFGSGVEWTKLDNQFSDLDGADVVKIPMKITNKSGETKALNLFYYSIYGSKGTKQDSISVYFDDDIGLASDMRDGASQDSYMHILYDGDGDYFVEFNNFTEKLEVKLPIQKQ